MPVVVELLEIVPDVGPDGRQEILAGFPGRCPIGHHLEFWNPQCEPLAILVRSDVDMELIACHEPPHQFSCNKQPLLLPVTDDHDGPFSLHVLIEEQADELPGFGYIHFVDHRFASYGGHMSPSCCIAYTHY